MRTKLRLSRNMCRVVETKGHEHVRLSLSVSRFVLDWKGLGRERGWVEGGIIYVPAARWSWSPRPPATQLCCAASHQQFHQHQHQHQRQGIYAYTHVVQCQHRFVCLDIRAFVESGITCEKLSYQTVIFATGQPMLFVQIFCKPRSGFTGPLQTYDV